MKTLRKCIIVFFLLLLVPCMFLVSICGGGWHSTNSSDDTIYHPASLSPYVTSYRPYVEQAAEKYMMNEYIDLILAVMQVESNGMGSDPMQSSEGPFNKKYPKIPNGIQDPYYSIDCGVQELKSVLDKARVEDSKDTERIKVALAGYNFGSGYIDWINMRGGIWTLESAQEFSRYMAQQMGWSAYGDPPYANKVMNYYTQFDFIVGEGDLIYPMKNAVITSRFGGRELDDFHFGLDMDAGYGSTIYSPADAKVYTSSNKCNPDGGYLGNSCPLDNHANGAGNYVQLETKIDDQVLYILMCHMKTVYVQPGQQIKKGQAIGEQGHSGNSTASHLHIEIHQGTANGIGSMQGILDPEKLLK